MADALEDGKIVDPDAVAESEDRQVFSRGSIAASFVGLRMRYDEAFATGPVVKLFGRTRLADGSVSNWSILPNRLRDRSVVLVTDPSDAIVNELFQTTADPEAGYFDVQGCNEFVVGVEVIAGSATQAFLDAKFI